MKVILLFDQIQAGYGGKERPNTPLGLEKGGIGSYLMFKDVFAAHDLKVLATVYCGPDYFQANKEEVLHKIANLMKKAQPDVLLCGPCFNYDTYAQNGGRGRSLYSRPDASSDLCGLLRRK